MSTEVSSIKDLFMQWVKEADTQNILYSLFTSYVLKLDNKDNFEVNTTLAMYLNNIDKVLAECKARKEATLNDNTVSNNILKSNNFYLKEQKENPVQSDFSLEKKYEEVKQNYNRLKEKYNRLKEEYNSKKQEYETLKDDLNEQLCKYKYEIDNNEDQINSLQSSLDQANSKIFELNNNLGDEHSKIKELQDYYTNQVNDKKQLINQLKKDKEDLLHELSQRFPEGWQFYEKFLSLSNNIRYTLKTIFKNDNFENFICNGPSDKSLQTIWDRMQECHNDNDKEDLDKLLSIFKYFLYLYNRIQGQTILEEITEVSVGEMFRPTYATASSDGPQQGIVKEIIIPGYKNTYNSKIIRKSLTRLTTFN